MDPLALSVSKEFPDASYHRPAAGQILGINDQPEVLRNVLSTTVGQVIRHAISKSTYIKMTDVSSTFYKIFKDTARRMRQEAFADRIRVDIIFRKDVTAMVR